jgi:hypothetical protein
LKSSIEKTTIPGMPDRKLELENCLRSEKVPTTTADISPEMDNDFHCPISGIWVEIRMVDGKLRCQSEQCGARVDDILL